MEIWLAAIGLGVGVLAAVVSFVVPAFLSLEPAQSRAPGAARKLTLGLALTIIFFLLTVPAAPPFSPGQRLGWGFLIGALVTLLAAYGCARLARPERDYWPYPGGWALSLALVAVSLTLLLMRGDPAAALLGCALGMVMVAGIFRISDAGDPVAGDLEAGAVLGVTLAAACGLAIQHFDETTLRGWWAYPLALAGFWLLGRTIGYLGAAPRRMAAYPVASVLAAAVPAAALALALGAPLAARLAPAQSTFMLLVMGLVTSALIIWLGLAGRTPERTMQAAALSAVLVIFLVVVSFKIQAGVGTAIALIGAWAIISTAVGLRRPAASLAPQALAVGANFLLLRLFLHGSEAGAGQVETTLHYTLIGLVIGVVLPFITSSLCSRPGAARALGLGALGSLTPIAVLTLWGPDAVLGLLVGLVGAQAIGLLLAGEAGLQRAPTSLLALGAALVAVQFGRSFAFLYQMPRAEKAYLAAGIAAVAVIWIVALGLARRREG